MPNNPLDKYKNKPRTPENFDGEQGSSDMGKDKLRREPDKGYPKPRDISKVVDEAHKIDGGFSGRLPNND